MTTPTELRGAPVARRLHDEIRIAKDIYRSKSGRETALATLLVGQDPAALSYRSSIDRTFRKVEIAHRQVEMDAAISNDELTAKLLELNADPDVTGVLVLMPLPRQLDPHIVVEHVSPLKDVDGITPMNAGRLYLGLPSLRPSTPAGGLELLDHYGIEVDGKGVTVIGRSNVVGRPLATLLSQRSATVTLCHSHTRDLAAVARTADIVLVASGRPGLVTGEMLKPGAVVIDFGVNVDDAGKLVGDADSASIQGIASAYTPVPGGTGPVTAMVLARNVMAAGFAQLEGTLDAIPDLTEAIARHVDDAEYES